VSLQSSDRRGGSGSGGSGGGGSGGGGGGRPGWPAPVGYLVLGSALRYGCLAGSRNPDPGSDRFEVPAVAVQPAAPESVSAPSCPPGPVAGTGGKDSTWASLGL